MNIDAVIIVVYFCGMLGCGILGMRLAKSREHFAVAGRTLNFWLYFPCLSTVLIGGGATFGVVLQCPCSSDGMSKTRSMLAPEHLSPTVGIL